MSETYNLGESVVHRGSQKMGKVVDASDSTKDGTTESVEPQVPARLFLSAPVHT